MNTGKSHYCINSKNMTPGTKYYYKIKAINTNSSGADSALSLAVSCTAGSASTNNTNTGNTSATASANAAAGNGSVYLNHFENSTKTSSHKISGTGAATVTSDANGNITVNVPDLEARIAAIEEKLKTAVFYA